MVYDLKMKINLLCVLIISTFSWGQKGVLIVRKVLIRRKSAYLGKWRISNLRYSLYRKNSSIKNGLFVFIFRKKIFRLKKIFLVFQVDFLFPKFEKNFLILKFINEKMMPITKKWVRLSIDEKIDRRGKFVPYTFKRLK